MEVSGKGPKKLPKEAAFILFRPKSIYIYIYEELTEQRNLGVGCLISEESKQSLAWGSKLKNNKCVLIRLLGPNFPTLEVRLSIYLLIRRWHLARDRFISCFQGDQE